MALIMPRRRKKMDESCGLSKIFFIFVPILKQPKKNIRMKKHFFRSTLWSIIAFLGVMLVSCGSDSKDDDPVISEPTFSSREFAFTADGGSKNLSIKCDVQPEVKVQSGSDWCSVAHVSSSAGGTHTYSITAQANALTQTREATLVATVKGLSNTYSIAVTQEAKAEEVTPEPDPEPTPTPEPSESVSMTTDPILALGMGWNLGNQMDAFNNNVANETCWGNPKATQVLFTKLKEAGFSSVRIPVTWMGHIGEAPSYTIETAWMDRVAEIVGYAKAAGLKAIVNIHHDGAESAHWLDIKTAATNADTNAAIEAELAAIWTQIAEKFKNEGDYLIFESMNEIHDGKWGWGDNTKDGGKQYKVFNEWQQVFVDAVRAVGGENTNRFLGIPGYCTNPDLTIKNLVLPTDKASNRLLVAVHFYDPTEYAINAKYGQWGHTAQSGKKETWGDESNVTTVFGNLKAKFTDKGIPVYIGEMGCVHRSNTTEESFRKYYLEYVCKAAKEYGLAPIYWDNGSKDTGGECFGLFNRSTGAYLNNGEEIVALMTNAVNNTDASYTLQSVYDKAPNP
jgi:endoglucanase